MPFSGRVPTLAANRIAALRAELRTRGASVLDLTESNPTRVDLPYPSGLLAPLAAAAALDYGPEPRGLASARRAVAADLERLGVSIGVDRLVLTASTSEAYGFLFKLLCNPGDGVLVPAPSYPLFDHLCRLEGVMPVAYPLDAHGGWSLDLDAVAARVGPRTRAVLVVSPNNPTGSALSRRELAALAALCGERGMALIGDEVFADYRFDGQRGPSVLQQERCLTFGLGGLSKTLGLPQLKLAWIGVTGPAPDVDAALARLDLIADTYLSVATPVQVALPILLDRGTAVRRAIQRRLAANLTWLRGRLSEHPACSLVEPAGGWSAVVRVPSLVDEEVLVLDALARHHVLVQPGYFYDFPHGSWIVLSLLVPEERFRTGVDRLLLAIAADHLR